MTVISTARRGGDKRSYLLSMVGGCNKLMILCGIALLVITTHSDITAGTSYLRSSSDIATTTDAEEDDTIKSPPVADFRLLSKNNVSVRPKDSMPDHEIWHTLTRKQMDKKFLKCKWDAVRPAHDEATWIGMREAYIAVLGTKKATVELDSRRTFYTAFQKEFEVRQSPGKGRGLFAMEDVKKGEVLYDFSQSGQFSKGSQFAEFLRILQPELACDVLMWSYVQYFGEGLLSSDSDEYAQQEKELRIVTDIDPGSFCNNGGRGEGNTAWLNAKGKVARGDIGNGQTDNPPHPYIVRRDGTKLSTKKSSPLVALRDIAKGEELLCIYSQFSEGLGHMIK